MCKENSDISSISLIRIEIGNSMYCIERSKVLSINRHEKLNVEENEGDQLGYLVESDIKIPVFSLGKLLNKKDYKTDHKNQRVLLINENNRRWGALVDRVHEMIEVDIENFYPVPDTIQNPELKLFNGVVNIDDNLYLLLNAERLHPENPKLKLKSYSDKKSVILNKLSNGNIENISINDDTKILFFSTLDSNIYDQSIVFALSITQVIQVMDKQDIIDVPESPDFVLGITNWRGRPVPVIDLNISYNLEKPNTRIDRILIVRTSRKDQLVGLPIQSDLRFKDMPLPHIPVEEKLPEMTLGVYTSENETLIIPDIDALLQ